MTDYRDTPGAFRKRYVSGLDSNLLTLAFWVEGQVSVSIGCSQVLMKAEVWIPVILPQTTWPLNPEPIQILNGWMDINKAKRKCVRRRQDAVLSLCRQAGLCLEAERSEALCWFKFLVMLPEQRWWEIFPSSPCVWIDSMPSIFTIRRKSREKIMPYENNSSKNFFSLRSREKVGRRGTFQESLGRKPVHENLLSRGLNWKGGAPQTLDPGQRSHWVWTLPKLPASCHIVRFRSYAKGKSDFLDTSSGIMCRYQ